MLEMWGSSDTVDYAEHGLDGVTSHDGDGNTSPCEDLLAFGSDLMATCYDLKM